MQVKFMKIVWWMLMNVIGISTFDSRVQSPNEVDPGNEFAGSHTFQLYF